MARLSLPEKLRRITTFLYGLNDLQAKLYLAGYGMDKTERQHGWNLFAAAAKGTLLQDAPVTNSEAARTLAELDSWENTWFPIVEASLKTRYPEIYQVIFKNLGQAQGHEVIITVQTLLDRIDELQTTGPGAEVRQLLEKRGLTEAERNKARTLLDSLKLGEDLDPNAIPEPPDALIHRAWDWYREWATIARIAIPRKRLRIAMGISSPSEGGGGEDLEDAEDSEPSAPPKPATAADPFAEI